MKLCSTCDRSVRRGWTGGVGYPRICLVCWTNKIMETFRYPKGKTNANQNPPDHHA